MMPIWANLTHNKPDIGWMPVWVNKKTNQGKLHIMKLRTLLLNSTVACAFALSTTAARADAMGDLVKAAKAEGELTVIALPHDWCGYGGVIDGFKAKYGLKVNELNPDAGSGDEVEAIKANKDNKGPQAPDVIDVGLSFGPSVQGRWPDPGPTRFPPGTRSPTAPRMPTASGMATITACSPSR